MRAALLLDYQLVSLSMRSLLATSGYTVSEIPVDEILRMHTEGDKFDIAVIDMLRYPDATTRLSEVTTVIVLTTDDSAATVQRAFREGAKGFLSIFSSIKDVMSVIEDARNGVVSADMLRVVSSYVVCAPGNELTKHELRIVRCAIQGKSNKQIAAELHLAIGTVKNAISVALQKLELPNRSSLILWAQKSGMGHDE